MIHRPSLDFSFHKQQWPRWGDKIFSASVVISMNLLLLNRLEKRNLYSPKTDKIQKGEMGHFGIKPFSKVGLWPKWNWKKKQKLRENIILNTWYMCQSRYLRLKMFRIVCTFRHVLFVGHTIWNLKLWNCFHYAPVAPLSSLHARVLLYVITDTTSSFRHGDRPVEALKWDCMWSMNAFSMLVSISNILILCTTNRTFKKHVFNKHMVPEAQRLTEIASSGQVGLFE